MPEDVIKPYAGGNPEGPVPRGNQIINVEGGKTIVLTPEAQQAAHASQEFARSFPIYEQAVKKGVNNLDPVSQGRLNEMRAEMRSNPSRPATVVNLHPWDLMFSAGIPLLRGIQVPACPPGQIYSFHHIRVKRFEMFYEEDGTMAYRPLRPIQLAGEFVREFSNKDNDGGGVIIYEGESNPDKVGTVETYDSAGRPMTMDKPGLEYDEDNRPQQIVEKHPVRRSFDEMLKEAIALRNKVYFDKVQRADRDYHLPDGRGRRLITEKHRLMAEVLFAEGIIPVVPEWNLASRMEQGLSENNCPACATPTRQGAFKCASCGHILSAFEAYKAGAIEYGHVSFETMSSDEWEQAEELKAEREKNRSAAFKKKQK